MIPNITIIPIIEAIHAQRTIERMRKIRPAYKKVKRVILSCETVEHLATALRMVDLFHDRFAYADKFSVELYKTVFDHKHGDVIMEMIQDGRA